MPQYIHSAYTHLCKGYLLGKLETIREHNQAQTHSPAQRNKTPTRQPLCQRDGTGAPTGGKYASIPAGGRWSLKVSCPPCKWSTDLWARSHYPFASEASPMLIRISLVRHLPHPCPPLRRGYLAIFRAKEEARCSRSRSHRFVWFLGAPCAIPPRKQVPKQFPPPPSRTTTGLVVHTPG